MTWNDIVNVLKEHGVWAVLVGVITSILIGIIKTPIRKKVIPDTLEAKTKKKREDIFDTVVSLSTYLMAFIAAMIYYPIMNHSFNIIEILELVPAIWLSQAMSYTVWKKVGLKRVLKWLGRLCFKDLNNDGKITLDEALVQVQGAYKNGKIDIGEILGNAAENLDGVLDEVNQEVQEEEVTPEMEAMTEAANGNYTELVENTKEKVEQVVEEVKETKAKSKHKIIDF